MGGSVLAVLAAAGAGSGLPHNDAGAYHRMVDLWGSAGRPVFIGWNEMTLLGHLAWGRILAACGLASVSARQWSISLQAALAVLLLAALARRLGPGPGRWTAVLAGSAWLANPISMLSATSFMTEIPATLFTAMSLAAFARWSEEERHPPPALWTAAAAAVVAFSVRQTSAVLVPAMLAGSLLLRGRARWTGLAAALVTGAGDLLVWASRSSLPLATIRPMRAMLVHGGAGEVSLQVARHLLDGLALSGLLLAPLALLARPRGWRVTAAAAAAMGAAAGMLGGVPPLPGNVLTAHGLVPDLLPPHGALAPVLSPLASWSLLAAGCLGAAALLVGLDWGWIARRPGAVAVAVTAAGTLAAAAVLARPFDRYLIPVLALAGPLAAVGQPSAGRRRRGLAWMCLAVLTLWGAWGSRAVHQRQDEIWSVASEVVAGGIPADRVDGGFEWNMWHQPVPFHPEEARPAGSVLVWYESYPFTRLRPEARLWVGPPPGGWRVSERHAIRGHVVVSVLRPSGPAD